MSTLLNTYRIAQALFEVRGLYYWTKQMKSFP